MISDYNKNKNDYSLLIYHYSSSKIHYIHTAYNYKNWEYIYWVIGFRDKF